MWEVIIEALFIWSIGYLPAAIAIKKSYLKMKTAGKKYYAHLMPEQINEDAMQLAVIWPLLLIGAVLVMLYGLCVELINRVK